MQLLPIGAIMVAVFAAIALTTSFKKLQGRRGHAMTNSVLATFDLRLVTARYMKEHKVDRAAAKDVELEFRRWLAIAAEARGLGMADCPVDHYWHEALAFTSLYGELCDKSFGRFIHHQPANSEVKVSDDEYAKTWMVYKAVYGSYPPEAYWPNPGAERLADIERHYSVDIREPAMPFFATFTLTPKPAHITLAKDWPGRTGSAARTSSDTARKTSGTETSCSSYAVCGTDTNTSSTQHASTHSTHNCSSGHDNSHSCSSGHSCGGGHSCGSSCGGGH